MEPSGNNVNSLTQHQQQQQQQSQLSQQNASTTQQHQQQQQQQQPQSSSLERLSRPMAFDKMEALVREMQDAECGVPVRSQKLFLTSIPSAFMGYDLIEWLMERLQIEESEALNIANQLCLHGYFFPVSDSKTLVVKDDSSLYRFQTPYYWPWQHKTPDNVEYAIYLVKRSLRNKQRHGLEDYEVDALASLHKNLKAKWDFITMQAEEQVKLAKDRKKGDKIVADSQERAFWRVHRPPPGQFTPLEPCPVPSRDRQGKPRRRTSEDCQREVDYLKSSMGRTRIKMSQACEFLSQYWETFSDYDFFLQSALPSNPWVTEDQTFWQLNNSIVDVPTEKRVRRWAISIEELVYDPTGLQEFTIYLKKEYSHENIRFWIAVNDLRRSAHSQISRKVREIYGEFLEPGAPCEINIDGKTMEQVQFGLKTPSRFTFDAAAEHIYALLLKKDCYPRFIRSEHYKSLLATGIQPSHKKRFFGFGGAAKKKSSTTAPPNMAHLSQTPSTNVPPPSAVGALARRRGSDRSLTGSAHELAICGVKDGNKVPHSHSQSNLTDIPYSVVIYRGDMPSGNGDAVSGGSCCNKEVRNVIASTATGVHKVSSTSKNYQEGSKSVTENMESNIASGGASAVCPWDDVSENAAVSVSVCPWDEEETPTTSKQAIASLLSRSRNNSAFDSGSSSSDISEISERMRKTCGIRQNTLDCELYSGKRLIPASTEPRRASITFTPRLCDMQFSFRQQSGPTTTTNIQHQPSFDKSKEIDENVLGTKTTTSASASTDLIATQSKTITVPTVKTTTAAQSLPPKVHSFDDRLLADVVAPSIKLSSTTSNSPTFLPYQKNIDVDDGDDVETNEKCEKPNEIISIQTEECENNLKSNTNISQTNISVVVSNESETSTNNETSVILLDGTKLVHSECERKSISASPPTITVLCAPCTDVILAETAAQTQSVEIIECDADSNETSTTAQNESSNDENVIADSTPIPTPTSTSPAHVVGSDRKLSLDVTKCDDTKLTGTATGTGIVVGSQEDLSPSMDEYQECCPTSDDYKYDPVTAAEMIVPGCVAPAPTPSPLIAPLAEVECYPPDDDVSATGSEKQNEESNSASNECAKTPTQPEQIQATRPKKKKQKSSDKGDGVQSKTTTDESNRNDVCPWEDEDGSSTSDGTFVKTYSTLGYL